MLIYLLTGVHVIVCLFLILVVLLQQGKSQDFSSTFGGGGTQASFGSRSGATLLTKATTIGAILFMVTSMTLTIMMTNQGSTSVIDESTLPAATTPAQTAAPIANDAAPADTNEDATDDEAAGGADAGEPAAPEDPEGN